MKLSPGRSPPRSIKKTVRIESDHLSTKDYNLSQGHDSCSQFARATDPDAYKDDWEESLVYKRAMKAEAIKRGKSYSEFEFDDDEEKVEMTQADLMSINEGSPRKNS